jgi:RNA polymerase sigma-70 factor, ECF subfamily
MEASSQTSPAPADDRTFERLRPRLFGVAYRMTGSVADAEDLVQEALLRWHESDRAAVREPEAWLVAVVTRLAIDHHRKAAARRAAYPGPWLPEPVDAGRLSPEYQSELASDVSMAFLAILERLGPQERAAFLLREVFGTGYPEIAAILGKREDAARQVVHRARARVRGGAPRFAAPPDAKERLLGRFVRALEQDDRDALLAVLADDAEFTSDGGGKVRAAMRTVRGGDRVARMLLGIEAKFGHHSRTGSRASTASPSCCSGCEAASSPRPSARSAASASRRSTG